MVVHVIRDKLNLTFQILQSSEIPEILHSERVKNRRSLSTVQIMSSLLLNKLNWIHRASNWTIDVVSTFHCLNHHLIKGKYLLIKIQLLGPCVFCLLYNIF